MASLQAPKKRYSAFSVCILLATLAPISTQEEPTKCTVEGLPDDGNEFTRDVGYQLNMTCTCYMSHNSHPKWDLVNVDNTSETLTFYIPYENTLHCEHDGTFTDETITCIPSSSSMTSFSLTIITNVSYSIVLQCRNHGTNASSYPKPIVVAINQERECTSSTPYQMTTLITPSSTLHQMTTLITPSSTLHQMTTLTTPSSILHQMTTVTVPSLTTDQISTQTPTCTSCLTANYTSVLSPSPSPVHSSTCSNATITLPFTTTLCPSFTNNDPCLLTGEGTIGLSSSLAFVIVIESVVIVVLLLVVAKISCRRNDKLKNTSEYAVPNGCYIEHD